MAERASGNASGRAVILAALAAVVAQSAGGGENDGQIRGERAETLDGVRNLQGCHFVLQKHKGVLSCMKLQRVLFGEAGTFAGIGGEADLGHSILFHKKGSSNQVLILFFTQGCAKGILAIP
jgi:hypothetical protein